MVDGVSVTDEYVCVEGIWKLCGSVTENKKQLSEQQVHG